MKIDFNIASLLISVESDEGITLAPGERFAAFRDNTGVVPDLVLRVEERQAAVPGDAVKVFDAPLYLEDENGTVRDDGPFWTVFTGNRGIYIKVNLRNQSNEPVLHIPASGMRWYYYTSGGGEIIDPLPYPVDGLVLYYLAVHKGGLMIHGSGIVSEGRGWLFSGSSGKGKTTIAMIFDKGGDKVIHDDRLILLRKDEGWMMYNTPVYSNEEPRSSRLDHIWLIDHGHSNVSVPVEGAQAVAMILSNCIQQNWNTAVTEKMLSAAEALVAETAVSRLHFVPEKSVREYLLKHEEEKTNIISAAAAEMLSGGRDIMAYAGGYSMWPSIRPGDRVIIMPLHETELRAGDIVALIRDGGFVVHRVTGMINRAGKTMIRTRGDAGLKDDMWSGISEIKGIVTEIIRSGKRQRVGRRGMPYLVNRIFALLEEKILSPFVRS